MASVKLTNRIREDILSKLTYRKYGEERAMLEARKYALANKVYNTLFDQATRTKMNDLPSGWLKEATNVAIQIEDAQQTYDYLYFSDYSEATDREYRRFPCEGRKTLVVAADSDLGVEYTELTEAIENRRKKLYDSKMKARAIVQSVNTSKQLKEVWPEVAPFVKEFETVETKTLPDVTRDELNSEFDLPVDDEKVAA